MSDAGRVVVFGPFEKERGVGQSVGIFVFRVGLIMEEGPVRPDRNPTHVTFSDGSLGDREG